MHKDWPFPEPSIGVRPKRASRGVYAAIKKLKETSVPEELCACGKPLHYRDAGMRQLVEKLIELTGEKILVSCGGRSWLVPRHYIALHGIVGAELPSLGFEEVTSVD